MSLIIIIRNADVPIWSGWNFTYSRAEPGNAANIVLDLVIVASVPAAADLAVEWLTHFQKVRNSVKLPAIQIPVQSGHVKWQLCRNPVLKKEWSKRHRWRWLFRKNCQWIGKKRLQLRVEQRRISVREEKFSPKERSRSIGRWLGHVE